MMVGMLDYSTPVALPLAEMAIFTGYGSNEIRRFIAGTETCYDAIFIRLPDSFPRFEPGRRVTKNEMR